VSRSVPDFSNWTPQRQLPLVAVLAIQ
jgi:hypothetical protein